MEQRRIEYMDMETGEITEIHNEAVLWFRTGSDVEVLLNGERATMWVH